MRGALFAALLASSPAWAGGGQSLSTDVPFWTSPVPSDHLPLPDVLEESVQLADSICGKLPSVTTDGVLPSVREEIDRIRTCRTDIVTKYLERRPKQ